MGLEKVSSNEVLQQTKSVDQKAAEKAKLQAAQKEKAELAKALSKGSTQKGNNVKNHVAPELPAKLEKKEGLTTKQKLLTGAGILGVVAAGLSFVKPSAAKVLKGAAKVASHTPEASKGLKASHALGAVGMLGGSAIFGSCATDILDEEHNHYVDIPTDTVTEEKIVEKIIEKPIYIKDTVFQTDTFQLPPSPADTFYLPGVKRQVKPIFIKNS